MPAFCVKRYYYVVDNTIPRLVKVYADSAEHCQVDYSDSECIFWLSCSHQIHSCMSKLTKEGVSSIRLQQIVENVRDLNEATVKKVVDELTDVSATSSHQKSERQLSR